MHLGWEGTLRGSISRTTQCKDDGVGDTVFLLQEYMFSKERMGLLDIGWKSVTVGC